MLYLGVYDKMHKNEPLHCFVTIFADNTSHVITILCWAKIPPKDSFLILKSFLASTR